MSALGIRAVEVKYDVQSSTKYIRVHRPPLRNMKELSAWIQSIYKYSTGHRDIVYASAIARAIKTNNIEALEYLWQGIYYNSISSPNYTANLYVAAEYSNLNTWLHILYAHANYTVSRPNDPLDFEKLMQYASYNQAVEEWLNANKLTIMEYIKNTN